MSVERYMIRDVITVSPESSIQAAINLMKTHSIRHLPVVHGQKFVGLITQSDLRGLLIPSMYEDITIRDVMIADPITVSPDTAIETAAALIYRNKIGALPVVGNEKLVGIITVIDIIAAFIEMMGVLEESVRLDIALHGSPDSFEEAIRIIKENGGEIISVGMIMGKNEQKIHSFRLKKTNLDAVITNLERAGHHVDSRYI